MRGKIKAKLIEAYKQCLPVHCRWKNGSCYWKIYVDPVTDKICQETLGDNKVTVDHDIDVWIEIQDIDYQGQEYISEKQYNKHKNKITVNNIP